MVDFHHRASALDSAVEKVNYLWRQFCRHRQLVHFSAAFRAVGSANQVLGEVSAIVGHWEEIVFYH